MSNNIFSEFGADPLKIFKDWFSQAEKSEVNDVNAMALATADKTGKPSVRMVLLKEADENGFTFFTNAESRKGQDLSVNPYAELNFHWKTIERQIRIFGPVQKVSEAEADTYFASRPRESQIGAWASSQTRPVESYDIFKEAIKKIEKQYEGKNVPRPPYWSGFRLKPERMEFWMSQPHRLHKRMVFEREKNGKWDATWLFP